VINLDQVIAFDSDIFDALDDLNLDILRAWLRVNAILRDAILGELDDAERGEALELPAAVETHRAYFRVVEADRLLCHPIYVTFGRLRAPTVRLVLCFYPKAMHGSPINEKGADLADGAGDRLLGAAAVIEADHIELDVVFITVDAQVEVH